MNEKKPVISAYSMVIIFVVLALSGGILLTRLPVSFNPTVGTNAAGISFSCAGMSARQIESEVTAVMESAVMGVEGVKEVKSNSYNGFGSLQISFEEGCPIFRARTELAQIIRQLYPALPKTCSYPIIHIQSEDDTNDQSLLVITVCSKQPVAGICRLLKATVIPALTGIKGISRVNISPESNLKWKLYYRPEQLQSAGISPAILASRFQEHRFAADLGYPGMGDNWDTSTAPVKLTSAENDTIPATSPFITVNQRQYVLSQLLTPVLAANDGYPRTKINGVNTIDLNISVGAAENVITIAPIAIATIQSLLKNQEVTFFQKFNAATQISQEIKMVLIRTLISLIGLFIFIWLIYRNYAYLWLTILSLLVNILISFACSYMLGIGIDTWMLAGIAISMGLTIDGFIVVTDHVMRFRNKKVFTALVVAHLTTMCTLVIMFFLDKSLQLTMKGFVWAVLINLLVSLPVAYYFVPSLLQLMSVPTIINKRSFRQRRRFWRQTNRLGVIHSFILLHKKKVIVGLIWLFGIPLFLLPANIDQKYSWSRPVNKYLNSDNGRTVRKGVETTLGGVFRLFMQTSANNKSEGKDRTGLNISMSVAPGAKSRFITSVANQVDSIINTVAGIDTCISVIHDAENANIFVSFKPAYEESDVPLQLKEGLQEWAQNTGLLNFEISGVGRTFSNNLTEDNTNYSLVVTGYNLDKVIAISEEVKTMLKANSRVRRIYTSTNSRVSNDRNAEFTYVFRLKSATRLQVRQFDFFRATTGIATLSADEIPVACSWDGSDVPVYLSPFSLKERSEWELLHQPVSLDSGVIFKLHDLATIEKEGNSIEISRKAQEYSLFINYSFFGEMDAGKFLEDNIIDQMEEKLPVGYKITDERNYGEVVTTVPMYLILLIAVVLIFILCSVLLNSLLYAWAVIWMMPLSFIGVFVAAVVFHIRPDSGSFAAMVFLAGIAVNWALYILNDYSQLVPNTQRSAVSIYLRAFQRKLIPIILSAISAIISVLPFVIGGDGNDFWFAFGVCTLGGLLASVIGTILLLPAFLRLQIKKD
ncbi:multidrug efflux pump subunit AcrB [Chitinophaga dinghuensis]|uniref:Multidrug efflux pump subunit AcrB n=1 Tax=Chitinophaga dinghuensis TaxID=1539050 RepID=A0A327VQM6_9BACT|nr:efflux RND transporter permease subunit [Chitinophaga dinghuensis]RAJ77353.1 multidrug efflux pump subunit AcrB [Chitinophaga dinghuensis]